MKILFIVYDNGSHIPFFPLGIAYLTTALEGAGHDVSIYLQDVNHYSLDSLPYILDDHEFDCVGLGFVGGYFQFEIATRISQVVNDSKRRSEFHYISGGHGPAGAPDYFIKKMGADKVFIGDAEAKILNWIDIEVEINPGGIYKEQHDFNDIRPAYDKFPIDIYRLIRWPTSEPTDFCMPILSGRGCPYKCNFCFRMEPGFKARSPESVIDEMYYLWKTYRINHFQFADELFMSSHDRVMTFCEAMIRSDKIYEIKNFKWDCNGRLNTANPENLAIMKRSGCEYINYGIESMDNAILETMNKHLTVDQIYAGVKATIKAGITPGLNFMWGQPGDTLVTLDRMVEFLIEYDTCRELRTIRPVTPYPGCELFDLAIEQGLLKDAADFYENKHINSDLLTVNFTELTDDAFHRGLYLANCRLIDNYYQRNHSRTVDGAWDFYRGDNTNFRGFRAI